MHADEINNDLPIAREIKLCAARLRLLPRANIRRADRREDEVVRKFTSYLWHTREKHAKYTGDVQVEIDYLSFHCFPH
jgi:hypothetical protein